MVISALAHVLQKSTLKIALKNYKFSKIFKLEVILIKSNLEDISSS